MGCLKRITPRELTDWKLTLDRHSSLRTALAELNSGRFGSGLETWSARSNIIDLLPRKMAGLHSGGRSSERWCDFALLSARVSFIHDHAKRDGYFPQVQILGQFSKLQRQVFGTQRYTCWGA